MVDDTSDADAVDEPDGAARAPSGLGAAAARADGRPGLADRDLPAHRTLLTSRSVEFDAVVVVALLPPAADARQSRDAKAAAGATPAVDPRLTLLVDEAFRHGKGIGVVGDPGWLPRWGSLTTRPGWSSATRRRWPRRSSRAWPSTGPGTASRPPADPGHGEPARPAPRGSATATTSKEVRP